MIDSRRFYSTNDPCFYSILLQYCKEDEIASCAKLNMMKQNEKLFDSLTERWQTWRKCCHQINVFTFFVRRYVNLKSSQWCEVKTVWMCFKGSSILGIPVIFTSYPGQSALLSHLHYNISSSRCDKTMEHWF